MRISLLSRLDHELVPCALIVAAAFCTALILRIWTAPEWDSVVTAQRNLSHVRTQVDERNGFGELLAQLTKRRDQLRRKLADLSQGLADPRDLSGLLQMLIAKADASDIRFVKMEPETEIKGEDYILYPVVLEMTTNHRCLGRFIAELEGIPQLVRVDRVGITAAPGGTIEAAVRVICFLSPEGEPWKTVQPGS